MSLLKSVDEALGLLAQNTFARAAETVPLDAALGARLAAPVIARVSRPPVAVSAMDGYAALTMWLSRKMQTRMAPQLSASILMPHLNMSAMPGSTLPRVTPCSSKVH